MSKNHDTVYPQELLGYAYTAVSSGEVDLYYAETTVIWAKWHQRWGKLALSSIVAINTGRKPVEDSQTSPSLEDVMFGFEDDGTAFQIHISSKNEYVPLDDSLSLEIARHFRSAFAGAACDGPVWCDTEAVKKATLEHPDTELLLENPWIGLIDE